MKRYLFLIFSIFVVSGCGNAISAPLSTPTPSITSTLTPIAAPPTSEATSTLLNLSLSPGNANNIVELARFGKGIIKQISWSPDGKTIAVATSVGIYFYNAQTFAEISYIDTGTRVTSIAYTSDSKMIAASDGYPFKTIRLWEVASGSLIQIFEGHSASVNGISIIGQNSVLVSGGDDGEIHLWNIQTGKTIRILHADGRRVESIALSENKTLLASGSRDGTIQLWNSDTGELLNTIRLRDEYAVMAVAFSPDGRYLASGGNDGMVTLFNSSDGSIFFSEENDRTTCLSFSPDGSFLASCSDDGTIRIREIPSGNLINTISAHSNSMTAVAYSTDGKLLLSGGDDGIVRVWETSTNKNLNTLRDFAYFIQDIAISPDGRTILSSGWKNVQLWDIKSRLLTKTINVGIGWQDSVAFNSNGRYFASLGCSSVDFGDYCQSSTATVWDFTSGEVEKTIDVGRNSKQPVKVLFGPDGNMLITADGDSDENNIKVWDITTGQLLRVLSGQYIHDLIFGIDSAELISAGLEEIWIRNLNTGEISYRILTDKFIHEIALSPEREMLAIGKMTGNAEGAILIWDIKGEKPAIWLVHDKTGESIPQIDSIAFNPDGTLLASGASDGTIYLWDTGSWNRITILKHTYIVTKLVFSDDGKFLISSSFDGTIRIWGIDTP